LRWKTQSKLYNNLRVLERPFSGALLIKQGDDQ
jgi:hypothetical protein